MTSLAVFLISVLIGVASGFYLFRLFRKGIVSGAVIFLEYILVLLFLFSFPLFGFCIDNARDYYEEIDPIDYSYTPIAKRYLLTFLTFWGASLSSLVLVWLKSRILPPLAKVLAFVFIVIGIGISVSILVQILGNRPSDDDGGSDGLQYVFAPAAYIIMSLMLIVRECFHEVEQASTRTFQNKFLNEFNNFLAKAYMQPLFVVMLLVPALFVVMLVLILFGQEADAFQKAFTETTTWHFSEKDHPMYLDHNGHYLCTAAACGHTEVVKPIRWGSRHGKHIIVNRQLMVANAFEQVLEEKIPGIHRFVRHCYDRYGFPLSKHIVTPFRSDVVYLLMKPLEWMFVIVLYLAVLHPEKKIAKQYE